MNTMRQCSAVMALMQCRYGIPTNKHDAPLQCRDGIDAVPWYILTNKHDAAMQCRYGIPTNKHDAALQCRDGIVWSLNYTALLY